MLVGFFVSNWKSIRNPLIFSMEATREQQHGERLTRLKKFQKRILPTAIMFGGNASGKSSFIQALQFMKNLVTKNDGSVLQTELKPYAFAPRALEVPSTFEVDLYLDGFLYNYSFSCTRSGILEEKLTKSNSSSDYVLFHREGLTFHFLDAKKNDRETQKRDIVAEATDENTLFLSKAISLKIDEYRPVYDWFNRQLTIIDPQTKFSRFLIFKSHEIMELYNMILPKLDTGIKSLELEKMSKADFPIPDDELDPLIKDIHRDKGAEAMLVHQNHFLFITIKEDGTEEFSRLISVHKDEAGNKYKLGMEEESDGTRRTLDFIPAFCVAAPGNIKRTFFIDEIDRSLHTELIQTLYECFFDRRREGSVDQIIATTHDLALIDQSLFRRDEMWAFERKNQGTILFSFSDFLDARHDSDLRNSYRQGRMGGVPVFDL